MKAFLKGSFFLLVANISAGVLSYFFQLRGAALLSAAAYGGLNTWLAYLGLALSLAGVAQYSSNFVILSEHHFRRTAGAVLVFVAGSLIALYLVSGAVAHGLFFGLSMLLGAVFQGIVGQFQGRTWFSWMGASLFIAAALKVAVTYWNPAWVGIHTFAPLQREELFYLALPLSFGLTCLFQAAVMLFKHEPFSAEVRARRAKLEKHEISSALRGATILAIAMALIPQMDLLNLRWLHGDETVGLFSRASLFAKAIFFAALTLVQVTLPHHIRASKSSDPHTAHRSIVRFEIAGLALCVCASIVLAWVGPWASKNFLGFDLDPYRSWILLSCLSLTALYGHLQKIQLDCALGKWKKGSFRLCALLFSMVLWRVIRPESVVNYLAGALAFYLALYLINEETLPRLISRAKRV
ncbi:MAG: hypothetical protein H7222_13400 [Methylotenera sp.]|nr:hypothetical protein [Oligoflexia bacterium]